jgi:hypothetical protein
MPLSPAPLLPGTSPLPPAGSRPPSRHALRLGAAVAVPALVAALAVGQLVLPQMLFLAPGLQAQVSGGFTGGGANSAMFQGFLYPWTRQNTGGGYNTPASLDNLQFEATTFHMNAVIIPVVADMPQHSNSILYWHAGDPGDLNTLPDTDYIDAIKDARRVGLLPILELQVKQHDPNTPSTDSPTLIGSAWSQLPSTVGVGVEGGKSYSIAQLEQGWFDAYTAFAVHYAQLSQQYHLPYFIIGDELSNTTVDTPVTSRQADPHGIINVPGDPPCPSTAGRRDCEWRHVIHALRSDGYATILGHQSELGANYTGKLIYAAYWGVPLFGVTVPEFDNITWWDAVDFIGVDAYFPLTNNLQIVDVNTLMQAWHGQMQPAKASSGEGDIVQRLSQMASVYNRPVLFTAAGYASAPGSNSAAGVVTAQRNDDEQLNDMKALLYTFTGQPWWAGVFWSHDEPFTPREQQPNWAVSSAWAGNTLQTSKLGGQFLADFYHSAPLPCSC